MKIIGIEGDNVGVVMSRTEAQVMHDILRHIGGPPRSRRKYSEQMLKTLRKDFGASEIQDFDNATHKMALYFK